MAPRVAATKLRQPLEGSSFFSSRAFKRTPVRNPQAAGCEDHARDRVRSGGLTVSRTTRAGRRAGCASQWTDRARLSPLSDVRVEPGDRILTESPALWKFTGELETVDSHAR